MQTIGECLLKLNITFKQESYVPYVIDAVNVVAIALHRYIEVGRPIIG